MDVLQDYNIQVVNICITLFFYNFANANYLHFLNASNSINLHAT